MIMVAAFATPFLSTAPFLPCTKRVFYYIMDLSDKEVQKQLRIKAGVVKRTKKAR